MELANEPSFRSIGKLRVCDPGSTLTKDLVREPGGFGLGQVPKSKKPDATTTMVCGYCSTGCGVDIHIKDGVPVNLSPKYRVSGELGHGMPQGLGSTHSTCGGRSGYRSVQA